MKELKPDVCLPGEHKLTRSREDFQLTKKIHSGNHEFDVSRLQSHARCCYAATDYSAFLISSRYAYLIGCRLIFLLTFLNRR